MELRDALAANFTLSNLILKGAYVLCIALVFEFIAFIALRRVDKWIAPLLSNDAGRDHSWRARRRATLRQTPRGLVRSLVYGIALILVFDVFGIPVLPLSLAVGSLAAITGAALLPILRDVAQGYTLLAEDAIAVGDVIQSGALAGTVERFTLRAITIRDKDGRLTTLSNRDLRGHTTVTRKGEDVATAQFAPPPPKPRPAVAFDPLAEGH